MQNSINCNGKLLDLSKPVVMGIINLTPDSFYKGSRKQNLDEILHLATQMIHEGAQIIDLGAVSTRPGAQIIDEAEELSRLIPALEKLKEEFPDQVFSIDSFRAKVAKEAIDRGVGIINDISGGRFDEHLLSIIENHPVSYILMHSKGRPENMQSLASYDDLLTEILTYFARTIPTLRNVGVTDIILDPGFGFAKTIQHNFELLRNLHVFNIFDLPVLVGLSRKSMIYKSLGLSPSEALNGTTALHMKALLEGAKILRVHDVKEAVETIELYTLMTSSAAESIV